MRFHPFSKTLFIVALYSVLLLIVSTARAEETAATAEAAKMLPDRIGSFLARGSAAAPKPGSPGVMDSAAAEFAILSSATRLYSSQKGEVVTVTLIQTRSDSAAYSLLTNLARWGAPEDAARLSGVGTAAYSWKGHLAFFKGPVFVYLSANENSSSDEGETLALLARELSAGLDRGENDIPVLVKHLPEWEKGGLRDRYVVSPQALQEAMGRRPVLDAVSFEGGVEAVTARYGPSHLVLIENTTPQLATDNDARINAKLNELRSQGQPLPTAYRRVGNYSVFVFDAPDEATAQKLIEGVKYEQVVQWLGQNPYAYQRAVRRYTETTAGVIVAVLKGAGLSLLLCLAVGGVFGALIFRRRRQQQAEAAAFSDAGGMLRLNLDEITNQYDPARALGPGERR